MLAIYTRISKEDRNDDGISLDNQKHRGVILANKLGLKFKVYEDEGKSGSLSVVKRPQLNQIFSDITNKTITTVYVLNQSRLDRGDLIQWLTIIKFFKDNKVKLYIAEAHQDLTNVSTELTLNVMALVNNNYLKQATENIKSALVENMLKGKAGSGPIINYGYKKEETNKVLLIDEFEAETVRLIYEIAIRDKIGAKAIAGILNDRGIPTKRMNITLGKGMMVKGEKRLVFTWKSAVVYSYTLYVN